MIFNPASNRASAGLSRRMGEVMVRETLARDLDQDPGFRWRGGEITRIEYLSDIVFALAFGMLVMSSSEPRTFEKLNAFLFAILPVTASFGMMVYLWNRHFLFFRRYGLADRRIAFLNAVLLLVVLFIAYPLRFIFDSLFGFVLLMMGDDRLVDMMNIDYRRAGIIMGYFMAGLFVVLNLFGAMYAHALSRAEILALSDQERRITKAQMWIYVSSSWFAALAGILAVTTPLGGFAGFVASFNFISNRLINLGFNAGSNRRRQKPASS